jgi:primosomal protein N' (replication factor Y)
MIASRQGISWVELRALGYSRPQLTALKNKELIIEQEQKNNSFYLAITPA